LEITTNPAAGEVVAVVEEEVRSPMPVRDGARKSSSRMPLRRSAKNNTDKDFIFVAASMVAMKKKIQARSVQIEGEADELY
jgi:hypothetical protein